MKDDERDLRCCLNAGCDPAEELPHINANRLQYLKRKIARTQRPSRADESKPAPPTFKVILAPAAEAVEPEPEESEPQHDADIQGQERPELDD